MPDSLPDFHPLPFRPAHLLGRMRYVGRFAPSPTGLLHEGSLVAAVASYLDAKVHGGKWLLRIEDVDEGRTAEGAAESIMEALRRLGMQWDGEVVWQSSRRQAYEAAARQLGDLVYPCACTRKEIVDSRVGTGSDGAPLYPGTCRTGLPAGRAARALRMRVPDAGDPAGEVDFDDRWVGPVHQSLAAAVGDFVLRRADGFWAYQLAVVVDDADQGITHVVRGADLLDSTGRQIWLQRGLRVGTPRYLHVPVVMNANGEKLSKQTGAKSLDLSDPVACLQDAVRFLGLRAAGDDVAGLLKQAGKSWELRLKEVGC